MLPASMTDCVTNSNSKLCQHTQLDDNNDTISSGSEVTTFKLDLDVVVVKLELKLELEDVQWININALHNFCTDLDCRAKKVRLFVYCIVERASQWQQIESVAN